MIVDETNRYHFQNPRIPRGHVKPWTLLTKEEFENFLGFSILMRHVGHTGDDVSRQILADFELYSFLRQ